MKRAYLQLTHDQLREKLGLPDSVQIDGCETPAFWTFSRIYLHGDHAALPEVPEGGDSSQIEWEDLQ